MKLRVRFKRLNAKLRGYYNYYGVHGNFAGLKQFFNGAMRILFEWLNRRSQRRSCNWTGYKEMLKHLKVEQPRIVGRPRACPEPVGYAQDRLVEGPVLSLSKGRDGQLSLPKPSCESEYV